MGTKDFCKETKPLCMGAQYTVHGNNAALFGRTDINAWAQSSIVWAHRPHCMETKPLCMGASPRLHGNKAALTSKQPLLY
jgi:hypothetical protein